MIRTEGLALAIWEAVREELPASKRAEVAEAMLRAFQEYGAEAHDLSELLDEDSIIVEAYKQVFHDDLMDDEDDEEE